MKVIKQTGTANTTYSPGRKIEWLAIHYTAGTTCGAGAAGGCASWFANPSAGGSADYICDESNLVQYNPDPKNRYCHAVGGSRYNTKGGRLYGVAKNSNCVSLEICSGNKSGRITYPNDPNYYFTTAVIAKAIESTKYLMDLYGIDADHVIRHYDVNGKECPGVIGWNTDSGNESKWQAFHAAIGGAPIEWFRVRMAWDKPETQLGAFTDKNNAIACADAHPGFSVYDESGKVIYTSKASEKPISGDSEADRWINLLAPDAVEIGANNGVLPSVMLAQASLETGWGKTDLAQRYNIFGMKADLINSTWDKWSTWDHSMWYEKYSPEERNGRVEMVKSRFRVYNTYRQCMEDYCAFLLHVQNNKGYKYARIKGVTDPAAAIHIIRIGTGTDKNPEGYATDSGYEVKVLNLIKKYNLQRFDDLAMKKGWNDSAVETDIDVAPSGQAKKVYRVQVEADHDLKEADKTMELIRERMGEDYRCFREKANGWWRVFCGSFEKKENAEKRRKEIVDAFAEDKRFQNAFIREVDV